MERSSFPTRQGAAALALALALAGCTSGAATPVTVVTAVPTPVAPAATPTPVATVATPTPVATATLVVTATPATDATPTAKASPAPVTVSPTPAPTATPAASPISAASACSGTTPDLKAFFVEAASKLSFDVYCAVLPSDWWLQSASYVLPNGGYLEAEYKNSAGADFEIREGGWCPPDKVCIAAGETIGPASFDGLIGTLYLNNTTYTIRVGTYANPAYLMVGYGMSQSHFAAWAAALVKVPKG
jgi:hypothetical protein